MMTTRSLRLAFLADPNETHTHRWLRWFAEHGHHVDLVAPPELELEGPLPPGVAFRALPRYGGRRLRPLGYLEARRAVRGVVLPLRPDVLHAHYLTGYGWLAWLSGIRPYAVSVWGSDVFRTLPASRKARWLGRLALAGAAVVTADSRDLADAAVAAGARRDRTLLVQFGVDTARFVPGPPDPGLRARLGLRPGRLVFSPRTLMDLYRHDVVLRAMAQLPADVLLLLSARHQDPATRARLDGLIDELDLQDRVTIAESIPHEEMAAVLRLADIVLSIPETDGTPVTILEALAVGRPVVASDVPSVREWLGDLDPGRLVPVGDVAATAAALRHVLETTDAASAAIAVAGRRMVVDAADHDANMRLMEARYAQLAADRPDGPLPVREGLP
jgi:glycosyltransferase involved in cell wall biosynthesis